jgi:hypothetical protein
VPDGQVTGHAGQGALVEDLRDQPEVLEDQDGAAVADRHAGGLLAAVLQGVEAVVGEVGDVLARRPDAEDAALLPDGIVGLEEVERGGGGRHAELLEGRVAGRLPARV